MGFWHTGYFEFHESTGLDGWKPTPWEFLCASCGAKFADAELLRDHRFAQHPLRRPILVIRGAEVGMQRRILTDRLEASDIIVQHCDRAHLDGERIASARLPARLARCTAGVVTVDLEKDGVTASFSLQFDIATPGDINGVEEAFDRLAAQCTLTSKTIEAFIAQAAPFSTATAYCDGICSYLYAVLAKERVGDTWLQYEKYTDRFNNAVDVLTRYDRQLARTMAALVQFHFNQFDDAALSAPRGSRIGAVSKMFSSWVVGQTVPDGAARHYDEVERQLTLWTTEEVLRWSEQPAAVRVESADVIESLLEREGSEHDRVKLAILLAETYAQRGKRDAARRHARSVRSLSAFEAWAERHIAAASRESNERREPPTAN